MSSTSYTRPVHRLIFDGMVLTLRAEDGSTPLARADLAAPDMARQIRDLATRAAASPRLTVVLPEAEVWRGSVRPGSRTPWGRRVEALGAAEAALGVGREALDVVTGPRARDGSVPVAAIRRQTVIDTLVFLDRAGIPATAMTGAGDFPGFRSAPLFRIGGRDWPSEAAAFLTAHVGRLPLPAGLRPSSLPKPRLPSLAGLGLPSFGGLRLPPASGLRLPPASRRTAFAVSAAAVALLLLGVILSGSDEPVPASVIAAPDVPEVIFPVADAPDDAPAEAAPAVLIAPAAPRARPADLQAPAPVTDRIDAALVPLPPALRPSGPADARPVTIASRTTPVVPSATMAAKPTGLTLAETPTARARVESVLRDTAALIPPPLAGSPIAGEIQADAVNAEAGPPSDAEAPRVAAAEAAEASGPAPRIAAAPPKPRATADASEALAETIVAAIEAVGDPVAAEAPPATAASLPASPPAPRRIATPTPKAASPAPIAVRAAVLAASAVPPAKAVAPPPPPPPAPVAVTKPAPEPAVVARAAPQAKPAKAAPTPTTERLGLSRSNVSLLGVFGTSKDRYALLRLPNGSVKRVGAGDSFQGVRVAAVGGDAVRLTQGQRDTVLTMPD